MGEWQPLHRHAISKRCYLQQICSRLCPSHHASPSCLQVAPGDKFRRDCTGCRHNHVENNRRFESQTDARPPVSPFEPRAKALHVSIRDQPPHNHIAKLLVLLHFCGRKKSIGCMSRTRSGLDVTGQALQPARVSGKDLRLHRKYTRTVASAAQN